MALNKIELIDVIKRHNDPNDATTIVSIQGTSVSNFFPERMRKGDIISIDNDDIVWKEYADDSDTPLIYRTGLDNIDMVKFIPAPGSYTVKDNGRVESTNTRTTVESPDGTVLRMVPGPQGDKGERGEQGPRGERGPKPEITINPVNNNWMVDGVDTNVNAVGPKGDKVEITINSANKHWIIDGVDTNIVAEGKDGKTPTVEIDNATKRWKINGVDTNIVAEGTKGEKGDKTVVTIDPVTKHWMIDGSDTNIVAEGTKGEKGETARIHIDPDNKHFIINGNDSGVRAEGIKGEDGATPDIKINEVSKHWFINGVDTNIVAEGTKGEKGDKTLITIDQANKHWLIDGVDTNIVAEGTRGTDGSNGKSAYEIALETGYVGSKEDWITSLKGEDGAEGSAGRDANSLNMNIALLGSYRNNDATGIKAIAVKPTLNDTELDKEQVKEQVKVTARFRGLNLRNSNENDDWKTIPNLSMDYDGDEIYVKGLPFTDGVRKGDPLETIFSFTYKGITTHCYRRLDNINDGVGSINLDNYIRREDLPTTLDTSHLIGRTEVEENYAKKSELPVVPSLEGYAKSVDVANDYATKQSVEEVKNDLDTEKGKISELSGKVTTLEADKRLLATKREVDETYAKKTDIPTVHSLEGYAKITEVEKDYAKKSEISALTDLDNKVNTSDLANYYTKTETVSKGEYETLKNTVDTNTGEITKLTTKASKLDTLDETYAKKIELPNVTGLISEATADSKYAKITEVERDYAKKTDIPTVHSLEGYAKITEVEKDYAKKSELPSVSGLISEVDADNKYAKKTDIPSLEGYAKKSEIPTGERGSSYDDTALSNRVKALESADREIYGTGYPERVVSAYQGTIYVDKAMTNGAYKWIKTKGGSGNTGWEVLLADTGWIKLNIVSGLGNSYVRIRRINNQVFYQFGGLSWGWFGIVRRNGPGFVNQPSDKERNVFILQLNRVPVGFRAETSQIGNIYNDKGTIYGTWYLGGNGDSNQLRFQFTDPIPTDRDIGDIRVSQISYPTSDPYPATLKIT